VSGKRSSAISSRSQEASGKSEPERKAPVADDLNAVFDELYRQSFVVDKTSVGHYSVKSPSGAGIVHIAQSGDSHAYKNILRDLKRIGFVWPPPPRPKTANGVSSKTEPCCQRCFGTATGECRNSKCVCHQPHVPPKPKDGDALYHDLSEAKVALQLADEVLGAKEKILREAQHERDEAEGLRKVALASFVQAKKLFDDHMLKDLVMPEPREPLLPEKKDG
jgi:hypothetical protein